jgi:hypothetical protein
MRGLDLAGFLFAMVGGAMQDLTSTTAGSKPDNWMWWLYSPSFF